MTKRHINFSRRIDIVAINGSYKIGVVTPTERPMRAIFVLLAMITYIFGFAVTEEMAWIFIGLQLFSVWKIAKMSHSVLAP